VKRYKDASKVNPKGVHLTEASHEVQGDAVFVFDFTDEE
jgi:hypothetical protein